MHKNEERFSFCNKNFLTITKKRKHQNAYAGIIRQYQAKIEIFATINNMFAVKETI